MLCQKSLKCLMRQDGKPMHLMEELEACMKEGYYLHLCTFKELCQLACDTYHAFGSTRSSYMAVSHNVSDAWAHFACFIDPQLDSHFPIPEGPLIASESVGGSGE